MIIGSTPSIFGNTFAEFEAFITRSLATYNSYQADPAQPLVVQYEWFAFFQSLNDFQERIVLSLTKVTHWEASFLHAYYTLLLQQNADDSLNFNERDYADFKRKYTTLPLPKKILSRATGMPSNAKQ